jgi:hypothetical protein
MEKKMYWFAWMPDKRKKPQDPGTKSRNPGHPQRKDKTITPARRVAAMTLQNVGMDDFFEKVPLTWAFSGTNVELAPKPPDVILLCEVRRGDQYL